MGGTAPLGHPQAGAGAKGRDGLSHGVMRPMTAPSPRVHGSPYGGDLESAHMKLSPRTGTSIRDVTLKSLRGTLALQQRPPEAWSSRGASRSGQHSEPVSREPPPSLISQEVLEDLLDDEIDVLLEASLEGQNYREAVELCRQSLRAYGKSAARHLQLSDALMKSNEAEEALDEADKAIKLDDTSPKAWLLKAKAHRELGHVNQTFKAMLKCEKLVARRTEILKPKLGVVVEDTRRRKEKEAEMQRRARRRELRSAPPLPEYLEPEIPWQLPQQRLALRDLQDGLYKAETGENFVGSAVPEQIDRLRSQVARLAPRWWILAADDEVDPELLNPPPPQTRVQILDEIFCWDLDSLLLSAVIGVGQLHDPTGKLQHQSRVLMGDLIFDEGGAVLVREQKLQHVVVERAGISLAAFLHTSAWEQAVQDPGQLWAVGRVSAMAAFQHLFELQAKHIAPLVASRPLTEARVAYMGPAEAEQWLHAMHAMHEWISGNAWRLLSATTQLCLHSILASTVSSAPDQNHEPSGYDPHGFLLHVLKICACQGPDALYDRIDHPTGVSWLLQGYLARMQVFKAAYHELAMERQLGSEGVDYKFPERRRPMMGNKLRPRLTVKLAAAAERASTAPGGPCPQHTMGRLRSGRMADGVGEWGVTGDLLDTARSLRTSEIKQSVLDSPTVLAQQKRESMLVQDPLSPSGRQLSRAAGSSRSLMRGESTVSVSLTPGRTLRAATASFRASSSFREGPNSGGGSQSSRSPLQGYIREASLRLRRSDRRSTAPVELKGPYTNWWTPQPPPGEQDDADMRKPSAAADSSWRSSSSYQQSSTRSLSSDRDNYNDD